ncbi:MAG: TolC family protein, partial [Ignavibacterium sp.]|uniref:TolC family protein n=1 Tax=Ignavibacterium sp. TaxID=2651167 RepID=UPI00404B2877
MPKETVTIKNILLILFFPVLLFGQEVKDIGALFDSLKTHPVSRADEINLELSETGHSMAVSHLFPNIDLFGKYDYSSEAVGLLPVPPNDLFTLIKNQELTQPFSTNIYRIGASISMPIFVKSIYSMISKSSMMYKSAESKKYINLLKNEAMIVSLNANLNYMDALTQSLEQKKTSLLKAKEFVIIKVN